MIPTIEVVKLNCGDVCQTLIIGSGDSLQNRGNGTDLVKDDNVSSSSSSYNVWNDDWSE